MIPSVNDEYEGTAAELAAFLAKHAGGHVIIPRHVDGDTFRVHIVGAF